MPNPTLALRRPVAALLVAGLVALVALSIAGLARPAPASADTASSMEASLLAWVNDARERRGLAPLVATAALTDLAGDRAAAMASKGRLDHDAAGCLRCQIDARGIAWRVYGETIGWTGYPWGSEAAHSLFDAWRGSDYHWDMLMGSAWDIVGVGVARRSADGSTYASIVLVDAPGGAPKPTPRPTLRPTTQPAAPPSDIIISPSVRQTPPPSTSSGPTCRLAPIPF